MKNRQKNLLYWGIAILVVGGAIGAAVYYSNQPGPLDDFARCLGEKGASFYGAYWCPACNSQKALFGRSKQYLPYIECSNPGQTTQNRTCTDAGIEGYPTWQFADGERVTAVLPLAQLAEETGCTLPQ